MLTVDFRRLADPAGNERSWISAAAPAGTPSSQPAAVPRWWHWTPTAASSRR